MTTPPRLRVTGHYAGAVSRGLASLLDLGIVLGLFTAGLAGVQLLSDVVFGAPRTISGTGPVSIIALVTWGFIYMYASLAIAGRTPGKGIVGLRVVGADGSVLPGRKALIRTVAFPFSIAILGLGLVGIALQREHRALHDLLANTAVIYDWGERAAEVPGPLSEFIARRAGSEYTTRPQNRPRNG